MTSSLNHSDQLENGSRPPATMSLEVRSIRVVGNRRVALLSDGTKLDLHRYSCIGEKDILSVKRRLGRQKIEAICTNGSASILPAFRLSRPLRGLKATVVVQEAMSEEDLFGYASLSKYHYRSAESFGRRAILVAYLETDSERNFAGYVEITNTFAGHKARNDLLNASFSDPCGVAWDAWNAEARAKYMNAIARISRCVVHPEFRGAGLGVVLCRAAIAYCRSHWHLAKLRPLFLEITADMLKFVPFAEKAGMSYIGTTSGNIDRVRKDQAYLARVHAEINSGIRDRESHSVFSVNAKSILQKQRADVERMQEIAAAQDLTVDQMLNTYLSGGTAPEQLTTVAYDLLLSSLRFPKPTYMVGLTESAAAFLSTRLASSPPRKDNIDNFLFKPERPARPIAIKNLHISYATRSPDTQWANAIREAFGLDKQILTATGVSDLNLTINTGDVLYIRGPSGSGKSGLLDVICEEKSPSSGEVSGVNAKEIAIFSLNFEEKPLVELLETNDLRFSLFCLNAVGLTEPALYLKTPTMLSTGQKHRLGFAKLVATRRPVWVIDEFCSVLDDVTATIVARNIGRVVRQLGVSAIIAGPRTEPVISALAPDRVLTLSSLGSWALSDTKSEKKLHG